MLQVEVQAESNSNILSNFTDNQTIIYSLFFLIYSLT
jgi:hypothetical protein